MLPAMVFCSVLIIIGFIFLILHLPVRVFLQAGFKENKPDLVINIHMAGIRLFQFDLSQESFSASGAKFLIRKNDKKLEDFTFSWSDLEIYKERWEQVHENLRRLHFNAQNFFNLNFFEWKTTVGLGDAAATGNAAGGVWVLKGTGRALLEEMTTIRYQPVMRVYTDFQQLTFRTEMKSMISFKVGQAMAIGIKFVRLRKGVEQHV